MKFLIAVALATFCLSASALNSFSAENQARLSDLRGSDTSLFSLKPGNLDFGCKTWTYVSNDDGTPTNIDSVVASAFNIDWVVKSGNAAGAVAQVDFLLRISMQRKKSEKFKTVIDAEKYEVYCKIKS